MLKYKAERIGIKLVEADTFYPSSKTCSACGAKDVVLHDDVGQSQRGNPIRRAIAEHFALPIDIIVRSPESLAAQRNDPYSFVHKALKEGAVLYERCAA